MSNLEGVDFLGFPCSITTDTMGRHKNICTKNPYEVEYRAFQYERFRNIQPENMQGRVNCIRKTIELNCLGKTPTWFLENDFEGLNFEKKELYLSFEDFLNEPVNHAEKPYNLLRLLDKKLATKGMSELIILTAEDIISCNIILDRYQSDKQKETPSIEGVEILKQLWRDNLIKLNRLDGQECNNKNFPMANDIKDFKVGITIKGWAWLGEPKNNPTNKVFIAMAFSAWNDDKDTMEAIQTAIKDACKDKERKLNYEASIVIQDHLENISNKIIAQIKEAKFIIADFTHNNSGVYYEAGLASGLGKPVIHLVRKEDSKKLHFDTTQINHLIWEKPEDIRRELPAWIKANIK